MTIFEYLANHSKNRSIDKVFIGWYAQEYTLAYIKRSKAEWDGIYSEFMGETERGPKKAKITSKKEPSIQKFDDSEKSVNKGAK